MPRTGRGGSRQGAVGTAYSNRTDLNGPESIMVAPNQQYGDEAEQRAAQGAIPMAPTDQSVSSPAPAEPNDAPAVVPLRPARQRQGAAPGTLPWLDPTNRPEEPITAGLPFGPGPGPEALGRPVIPNRPVTQDLDQIASNPDAAPQVSSIADAARMLGL